MTSKVQCCSQFVDNRIFFAITCVQAHFHSYFLRLVVSHALLSTDARFFLFPAILVAQVLVGAMGNTSPIWMWCWGHFCCYSLLMDFVHLRVGPWSGFFTSTSGLHSFIDSLSLYRRCALRFILTDPLMETRSQSPKHRRGESEWIRLRLMDSPTFSSTSRSAYFGDLPASTSVHHDVYTGDSLLHIMNHFQVRTSTYDFLHNGILFGATFFS